MANRPTAKVAVLVLVAFALTIAFAGTAFAHNQDSASLSCATVTGTFSQFGGGDHPIVWHVAVDGHAYQAVATAESPHDFVGNGTATADIATLTKALGPAGGIGVRLRRLARRPVTDGHRAGHVRRAAAHHVTATDVTARATGPARGASDRSDREPRTHRLRSAPRDGRRAGRRHPRHDGIGR